MSRMILTSGIIEQIKELWPSHTPMEIAEIIGHRYYRAMTDYASRHRLKHNDETMVRIRYIRGKNAKNGNTPEANRKRAATIKRKTQERKLKQQQLMEKLRKQLNIK